MGMMWACLQDEGKSLYLQDELNMAVRAAMPCLPRCLRCMFETPSGPVAEEFLSFRGGKRKGGVGGRLYALDCASDLAVYRVCGFVADLGIVIHDLISLLLDRWECIGRSGEGCMGRRRASG